MTDTTNRSWTRIVEADYSLNKNGQVIMRMGGVRWMDAGGGVFCMWYFTRIRKAFYMGVLRWAGGLPSIHGIDPV